MSGQQDLAAGFRGLQNRQDHGDGVASPSRVMNAWLPSLDGLPQRIERIALPWPANAAQHRDLTRAGQAMNDDPCRRQPYVAFLARRNDEPEVRQIRLLVR